MTQVFGLSKPRREMSFVPVVILESSVLSPNRGLWLVAFEDGEPEIIWLTSGDEPILGGRGLRKETPLLTDEERKAWVDRIDTWQRSSANDCLRARGDIRWIAASTATQILTGTKRSAA